MIRFDNFFEKYNDNDLSPFECVIENREEDPKNDCLLLAEPLKFVHPTREYFSKMFKDEEIDYQNKICLINKTRPNNEFIINVNKNENSRSEIHKTINNFENHSSENIYRLDNKLKKLEYKNKKYNGSKLNFESDEKIICDIIKSRNNKSLSDRKLDSTKNESKNKNFLNDNKFLGIKTKRNLLENQKESSFENSETNLYKKNKELNTFNVNFRLDNHIQNSGFSNKKFFSLKCRKNKMFNHGRWTDKEHRNFIEAIIKYGNNWTMIRQKILTRSASQARSHAQKCFLRLKKDFKIKSNVSLESFTLFNKIEKNIANKINNYKNKNIVNQNIINNPDGILDWAEIQNDKKELKILNNELFNKRKSFLSYKSNLIKLNEEKELIKELFLDYLINLNNLETNNIADFSNEMKDFVLKEFILINKNPKFNKKRFVKYFVSISNPKVQIGPIYDENYLEDNLTNLPKYSDDIENFRMKNINENLDRSSINILSDYENHNNKQNLLEINLCDHLSETNKIINCKCKINKKNIFMIEKESSKNEKKMITNLNEKFEHIKYESNQSISSENSKYYGSTICSPDTINSNIKKSSLNTSADYSKKNDKLLDRNAKKLQFNKNLTSPKNENCIKKNLGDIFYKVIDKEYDQLQTSSDDNFYTNEFENNSEYSVKFYPDCKSPSKNKENERIIGKYLFPQEMFHILDNGCFVDRDSKREELQEMYSGFGENQNVLNRRKSSLYDDLKNFFNQNMAEQKKEILTKKSLNSNLFNTTHFQYNLDDPLKNNKNIINNSKFQKHKPFIILNDSKVISSKNILNNNKSNDITEYVKIPNGEAKPLINIKNFKKSNVSEEELTDACKFFSDLIFPKGCINYNNFQNYKSDVSFLYRGIEKINFIKTHSICNIFLKLYFS